MRWAASSYSANFYDVRAAIEDTSRLTLNLTDILARERSLDQKPDGDEVLGPKVVADDQYGCDHTINDASTPGRASLPQCDWSGLSTTDIIDRESQAVRGPVRRRR